MNESVARASFRKRHPVLARGLLFGLGGGAAALLLVLLSEREAVDRADRRAALQARIEMLPIAFAADRSGKVLWEALEAPDLAPKGLPAEFLPRVLRWRGLALAAQGRGEEADAAYGAAWMLDQPRREVGALLVEWASARLLLGRPEDALFLLDRSQVVGSGPLGLLGVAVRSLAEARRGRAGEAAARLEAALAALDVPLPDEPRDWVCPVEWGWAEAAVTATEHLVDLRGEVRAPGAWVRLAALAPGHFEAQWKAARGLRTAGEPEAALQAWARAAALDPDGARALARRDPDLGELEARRAQGSAGGEAPDPALQSGPGTGR